MSECPQPALTGNAAVHSAETLTPERIDTVLGEFRSWLQEAASAGRALPPSGLDGEAPEGEEAIDLHTLLAQFIAMRHEVNLQTRAVRSQQEQNAETLRQLSQALAALTRAQAAEEQGRDDQLKPLLKTLLDIHDALSLATREAQRIQEAVLAGLEQLTAMGGEEPEPRLTGLAGWLGHDQWERLAARQKEQKQQVQQVAGRVRQFLDSLVTGYTMSQRRVERALEQFKLEPIPSVGRPYDPEEMEVVEAVMDSGRPAGEVIDEIRRGYRWNGRIFRYAQVRVAKG